MPTGVPTQLPPDDSGGPGGDGWGECTDTVDNPDDEENSGWFGWLYDSLEQFWSCSIAPILTGIQNSVNSFFTWVGNATSTFFDWAGSLFAWASGTVGNIGTQISNAFQGIGSILQLILAVINSVLAIIGLVWSIFIHLMELMVGWIGQFMATAEALVLAWWNASPTPIPFLPQCASNPLDSNVCAFWYLLDHMFLGGTLGDVIVALFVILLDMVIVFEFIVTVMNILREGDSAKK